MKVMLVCEDGLNWHWLMTRILQANQAHLCQYNYSKPLRMNVLENIDFNSASHSVSFCSGFGFISHFKCVIECLLCLWQVEEEIHTLRQVLSAKEKHATELKRKLGLSPLSELKQNLTKGWQDVQTSNAWVEASRRSCCFTLERKWCVALVAFLSKC